MTLTEMRKVRASIQNDLYTHVSKGLGEFEQMPEEIKADQFYWATRSLEDSDDEDHDSASDKAHLDALGALLDTYVNDGKIDFIHAICSALATYDPSDNPSHEIAQTLSVVLADDRFKTIQVEAAYALQQLTGERINIASYWTM